MARQQLSVDGMACDGCESAVENALQSVDMVTEATANHESGTVEVVTTGDVDDEVLRDAVTDAGYEVPA